MPFVTGLFIISFCFVFYLIWYQFLRKDTRLSIGLKVLQKKMNMLETLSHQTDVQLNKGIALLDKKNKELEKIVSEARFCIFKMEKMLSGFEEKNSQMFDKKSKKPPSQNISLVSLEEQTEKQKDKKIQKITLVKKEKFDFGESPFSRSLEEEEKPSQNPFPTLEP